MILEERKNNYVKNKLQRKQIRKQETANTMI